MKRNDDYGLGASLLAGSKISLPLSLSAETETESSAVAWRRIGNFPTGRRGTPSQGRMHIFQPSPSRGRDR